jgi:hypothetical protein
MKKISRFALSLIAFVAIGCGGTGGGRTAPKLDGGTNSSPDLAMTQNTKPDLAMAGNGKTGCSGALDCLNNCTDQACSDDCKANATTQGWSLLQNLAGCLFSANGACPGQGGGVCDDTAANYSDAACNSCLMKAQTMGGACYQAVVDCANSTP